MSDDLSEEKEVPLSSDFPEHLRAQMEHDAGLGVPTDDQSQDMGVDYDDPFNGIAFGLPVLEQLILALIDARPLENGPDRKKRLGNAIKAITGKKLSGAPLPESPQEKEDQALRWMADQYIEYKAKKGIGLPDSKLAELAAVKFYPSVDDNHLKSRIDDLRHKYDGVYEAKKKKWSGQTPPNTKATLKYRVSEHDYVRESVEAQVLGRIQAELADAGVRMILPD